MSASALDALRLNLGGGPPRSWQIAILHLDAASFRVPALSSCWDRDAEGGAGWWQLVDWPSGSVARHPLLRADHRCFGPVYRLAASRDPAVRVGWRHGRTASIRAERVVRDL